MAAAKATFAFSPWRRDPHWRFFPTFIEHGGHILIDYGNNNAKHFASSIPDPRPNAFRELEWNYMAFDEQWPGTPFENWRINLALAKAARVCWLDQLSRQFPGIEFRTSIRNDLLVLCEDESDDDRITAVRSIFVKLYLWTRRGDPDDELETDRWSDAYAEMIDCSISGWECWSAEKVFKRGGEFRASFVRHVCSRPFGP